jgi:protease-4
MGSLAASGGYYAAMPAEYIFAERTTITGSIGVYAAFPNVAGLATRYGVSMNVIKAGDIKDSGSMFHDMTAPERQVWQDMVDGAYDQFLEVVGKGRPKLKDKLTEIIPETRKEIMDRNGAGKVIEEDGKPKMVSFFRRRADGGIFTAKEALAYGLIDEIGYLEDAAKKAAEYARKLGTLGDEYKVVTYEKPQTLLGSLLGVDGSAAKKPLTAEALAEGTYPRLWYLAPQSEMSGILTAIGQQ